MAKKRFSPKQIVTLLRQIEVATAQGKSVSVACREAGISDQSYFRWYKKSVRPPSRRSALTWISAASTSNWRFFAWRA